MELTLHFYRAKKLLWPSIPNPENSNAVQKIEIAYELVSKRQYNDDTIHFIVNIQKIIYKHYWDRTRITVMTWDGYTMVYKVLHRISLSYHSACQKGLLFSCIYYYYIFFYKYHESIHNIITLTFLSKHEIIWRFKRHIEPWGSLGVCSFILFTVCMILLDVWITWDWFWKQIYLKKWISCEGFLKKIFS